MKPLASATPTTSCVRELKPGLALLTFSHCSGPVPTGQGPAKGGRQTAMAGSGAYDRVGRAAALTYLAVSKASGPPPKHSSLPKGTNICPKKNNHSCRRWTPGSTSTSSPLWFTRVRTSPRNSGMTRLTT